MDWKEKFNNKYSGIGDDDKIWSKRECGNWFSVGCKEMESFIEQLLEDFIKEIIDDKSLEDKNSCIFHGRYNREIELRGKIKKWGIKFN